MRIGEFEVTLRPVGDGRLIEEGDGRVLARPGQVYAVRLRNHGGRTAVVRLSIDGTDVTEGGELVLRPGALVDLERPTSDGERGRFTVFPEGREDVFGPDGGRGNPDLGLIEASFRREKERQWIDVDYGYSLRDLMPPPPAADSAAYTFQDDPPGFRVEESAAGTGLTGRSQQSFHNVSVGPLERRSTVIRLRLVIGRPELFEGARPLPGVRSNPAPTRPTPRP